MPKLTYLGKIIFGVIAVALLFLLVMYVFDSITAKPKAEAKLGKNQVEASSQSGRDASNTVANAGMRDTTSENLTRTNSEEIMNAEGADQTIAAPVRDAGLASLCRRASYREHPKCVQYTNP